MEKWKYKWNRRGEGHRIMQSCIYRNIGSIDQCLSSHTMTSYLNWNELELVSIDHARLYARTISYDGQWSDCIQIVQKGSDYMYYSFISFRLYSFGVWTSSLEYNTQTKSKKHKKWFIEWNETIPKTIKEAQRPQ